MPEAETSEDNLLGGRVRLLQLRSGHRAGTDAVLLAAALRSPSGAAVADVGAGTGAVGLMVAARVPGVQLTLVEREPDLAGLCRRNLALNALEGRVVEADILDTAARRHAGLGSETVDAVFTNPPYLDEAESRLSPDAVRARAHALPAGGLAAWIEACLKLVKPGGSFALVHRADRLTDCLNLAEKKLGSLRLRLVHPHAEAPATRLLLTGTKGSRAPLSVLPPLVLHRPEGGFTPFAEALHRGEVDLS